MLMFVGHAATGGHIHVSGLCYYRRILSLCGHMGRDWVRDPTASGAYVDVHGPCYH